MGISRGVEVSSLRVILVVWLPGELEVEVIHILL